MTDRWAEPTDAELAELAARERLRWMAALAELIRLGELLHAHR